MTFMNPELRTAFLFLAAVILFSFATPANAQRRDHLTDPESELIRFHQQLDKRIEVFIKAVDRRFAIINGAAEAKTKKLDKAEPEWGELPKGSRAELLGDIAAILDEAITNIDDVSQHDQKNPLISRSLRKLHTATNGYVAQFNTLREGNKNADELAAIERGLEQAAQIIEAGSQLPPPVTDKKKDKP
jgi:hypothetical protein